MESARSPGKREATPPKPNEIKWYFGIVLKEKDGLRNAVTRLLET